MKILLNAEAFGFGPTAAIALIHAQLHARGQDIDYAGQGHTLDLQRGLAYGKIYDMTGRDDASWHALIQDYDGLLTGMDERVARTAVNAGVPTAFYDALAWWWPDFPAVTARCLHLAQDFIGVAEKTAIHSPRCIIVPSLTAHPLPRKADGRILVNLGGLSNPSWGNEQAVPYARIIIQAIRKVAGKTARLDIAANQYICGALGLEHARPRHHDEMAELYAASSMAFMTPGLGNIMDAASTGLPMAWLPPTNASQASQMALLRAGGYCDGWLGWLDILKMADADIGSHDNRVLVSTMDASWGAEAITSGMPTAMDFLKSAGANGHLARALSRVYRNILSAGTRDAGRAGVLQGMFGTGGAEVVAEVFLNWLQPQVTARAATSSISR